MRRLVLFGIAWTSSALAMTPAEVYREVSPHVVVLEIASADGTRMASSSALLVGDGRAIAQCSVLAPPASQFHLLQDGRRHAVRAGSEDLKRNLCVLHVGGLKARPLQSASVDPSLIGARVFAVSNPLGLGIGISEGVVSGLRSIRGETLIQFTAPIAPGSEGGGLFDESGRLIAIIRYRHLGGQNVNFAVPASAIAEIDKRSARQADFRAWHSEAADLHRRKDFAALVALARVRTAAAPDELEPWVFLAFGEWGRGAHEAAERTLREALARHADEQSVHLYLVQVLIGAKRYQAAIDAARAAQQLFTEDPGFSALLGTAEMLLGRPDAARQALEEAVRLDPTNSAALEALVRLASAQRDPRGVARALAQLASLNSQEPNAWLRLSQAHLNQRKAEHALAAAERALALQPGNADALHMKAQALATLGRRRESIDFLLAALARGPQVPVAAWLWLGYNYFEAGLYSEAIAAYRQALQLDPNNVLASDQLAVALKDAGLLDEAMAMFEKTRDARPSDPFGWRQIGYVHAMRDRPELAIPALERALELEPQQAKVWAALLETYASAQRFDDMRRAHRRLEELDKAAAASAYRRFILPHEIDR